MERVCVKVSVRIRVVEVHIIYSSVVELEKSSAIGRFAASKSQGDGR